MKRGKNSSRKQSGDNEITLDFDAALVSPDNLKKAVNAFVDLLKSVSDAVANNGKKVQWNMSLREGSCLVIAEPVPDVESTRTALTVLSAIPEGLKLLEKGISVMPDFFDEKALKAAKELASLRNPKGLRYIKVRTIGKNQEVSLKSIATVDRILGGQHQSVGSIEGKLQTITERGQLQFVVYDTLFDRGVNCFMSDEIAAKAIEAFRRRVSVSGIVQYDKNSRPVSIKVDSIRIFKDDSELPHFRELRGILKR